MPVHLEPMARESRVVAGETVTRRMSLNTTIESISDGGISSPIGGDVSSTIQHATCGGPLSGHERTSRLEKVLPEERGLWQTLHYFPFSAAWDEEGQKKLAVEHARALFLPAFTSWYKKHEMDNRRKRCGMNAPPPAVSQNSKGARKGNPLKKKRPSKKKRRNYNPDYEDHDDEYGYDEEQMDPDSYANAVARSDLQNEEETQKKLDEAVAAQVVPYLSFLKALPECEPLTVGFVLLPVSGQKCCFCPCSYRLRGWRSRSAWADSNGSGGCDPQNFRPCGNEGKAATAFHAPGLVAHVEQLKAEGDWWHWLINEYLKQLFRHYMGPDRPHKALLPPNSRKYNATERLEFLAVGAHMKSLSESEEAHKQKLAGLRLKTAELESHCKHLAESLDKQRRSENALRNILAASWDSFSLDKVSDDELRQYQTKRDNYFSMVRKVLPTKKRGTRISVKQESFNLQAILEANPTLFLNDLSPDDAAYWLRTFEIQYEAPETGTRDKLQKRLAKDMSAIDRGGPTRQFLSEAFQSLDQLTVKYANKETKLWKRDEKTGFYFPQEDETILHDLGITGMDRSVALQKARSIVRPLARAIGRLIFYCMANVIEKDNEYQTADQRLHVDSYVFPEIYLYYLLAGVKPSSRDYPLGDLVKFVSKHRLMSKIDWESDEDSDKMKAKLREYISIVLDEQQSKDQDLHESVQQLREGLCKAAEIDFIDGRQLVLVALQEGLSLDDHLEDIDTQMVVGRAPVEGIRRMFLSMPSCNVHNVINCLKPKYTEEYPVYVEVQKRLLRIGDSGEPEGLLPDVLKTMCEEDPDVAGTFMFFATGMRYTPYQDKTFRILVEFTFSALTDEDGGVTDNMLPWAHTCPRDILFPGFAYNGDANVLREKLSKVLEYAHSFNME